MVGTTLKPGEASSIAATRTFDPVQLMINSPEYKKHLGPVEVTGGIGAVEQYKKSFNSAVTGKTERERTDGYQNMIQLQMQTGRTTEQATKVANGQLETARGASYLNEHGEFKKAQQLVKMWEQGKVQTAEDVFKQMQSWGYTDWVRQERERLATYEHMITSIADSISRQMAAQQAKTFAMTSTTQQLQAIIEFVDKKLEEIEDERRGRGGKEEEPEARQKKKSKKEDAEELLRKIETGTEVEKPVESKLSRMKLYDEVEAAQRAKDGLDVKELVGDTKFQQIYEDKRDSELRGVLKDIVPAKMGQVADIMKAGKGGQKVDLNKYDIAIQTALVSAYRKSLEEYTQGPKVG